MQPMKVLVIAMFVALVVRKLDDEEKSEVEKQARLLARDEEWLHPAASDTDLTVGIQCQACAPSDRELAYARDERIKEIKMKAITRELTFYVFFCFVVYVLGMSTRDTTAYHQTVNMRDYNKGVLDQHEQQKSKKLEIYQNLHATFSVSFTVFLYIVLTNHSKKKKKAIPASLKIY